MPKRPDDPEWFEDAVVGGVIPGNFIPAVQKGVVEGLTAGAVAGYPVTDVKISVYDGSYHEVDSSEIAFKVAGSMAFQAAAKEAKPVLLEPLMEVEAVTPEEYMGDVIGDLNSRRGRIEGMEARSGAQAIAAQVPLSEMSGYATVLRSRSQGRGTFTMQVSHFEEVPKGIQESLLKK